MYDVYVFVLGFTVSVELGQLGVWSLLQVVNTLFQSRNISVINSSIVISEHLHYVLKTCSVILQNYGITVSL